MTEEIRELRLDALKIDKFHKDRAARFEEHLVKLVEMWNSYKVFRPEVYFKAIGTEFTAAEKSLKELGVWHEREG